MSGVERYARRREPRCAMFMVRVAREQDSDKNDGDGDVTEARRFYVHAGFTIRDTRYALHERYSVVDTIRR